VLQRGWTKTGFGRKSVLKSERELSVCGCGGRKVKKSKTSSFRSRSGWKRRSGCHRAKGLIQLDKRNGGGMGNFS